MSVDDLDVLFVSLGLGYQVCHIIFNLGQGVPTHPGHTHHGDSTQHAEATVLIGLYAKRVRIVEWLDESSKLYFLQAMGQGVEHDQRWGSHGGAATMLVQEVHGKACESSGLGNLADTIAQGNCVAREGVGSVI
jgi:hypothetical protein